MTKVIREYKKQLDELLTQDSSETDWDQVSTELLSKIGFYQHERLVHLIVTMTMAVITILCFLALVIAGDASLELLVLLGLLLLLLAPYIVYYFMLENSIQDIYKYYDKVRDKLK